MLPPSYFMLFHVAAIKGEVSLVSFSAILSSVQRRATDFFRVDLGFCYKEWSQDWKSIIYFEVTEFCYFIYFIFNCTKVSPVLHKCAMFIWCPLKPEDCTGVIELTALCGYWKLKLGPLQCKSNKCS